MHNIVKFIDVWIKSCFVLIGIFKFFWGYSKICSSIAPFLPTLLRVVLAKDTFLQICYCRFFINIFQSFIEFFVHYSMLVNFWKCSPQKKKCLWNTFWVLRTIVGTQKKPNSTHSYDRSPKCYFARIVFYSFIEGILFLNYIFGGILNWSFPPSFIALSMLSLIMNIFLFSLDSIFSTYNSLWEGGHASLNLRNTFK